MISGASLVLGDKELPARRNAVAQTIAEKAVTVFQTTSRSILKYACTTRLRMPMMAGQGTVGVAALVSSDTRVAASPTALANESAF